MAPKRSTHRVVALTFALLVGTGGQAQTTTPGATTEAAKEAATNAGTNATTNAAPNSTTTATTNATRTVTPAVAATPAEPAPDETNAQRARTQPGNNAPFWRDVRQSWDRPGYTSLPGAERGVLIQRLVNYPGGRPVTAGEAWRQLRNRWIVPYGGALLLIAVLALALLYWRKGPIGARTPETGRRIERFSPFERAAHWTNAIAFVVLALSGLVMAFGRHLLLPLVGAPVFGAVTNVLKTVHNFAGPLFAVSLLVMIATFARDNLPQRGDAAWLRQGGGLLTDHGPPAHRYNPGEKIVFWFGVLLLGLAVVGSGLVLDGLVPGLGETRNDMQAAQVVHGVGTMLMMAVFIGHIYLGTIGTRGAYAAMRTGWVDAAWAREHHRWWYEDIAAGRISERRSGADRRTAPAPVAAPPTPP